MLPAVPSGPDLLLFALEDETTAEEEFEPAIAEAGLTTQLEALSARVNSALRHTNAFARQLHADVVDLLPAAGSGSSAPAASLTALALALQCRGYQVKVKVALGGGTSECFRSLRHEFLVVHGSGDYAGMEFIVEPALRQHFAIPHASPEYAFVHSRMPEVFVGGSCRLVPIIQIMCALMADSFERQGLALPPWRKEQAMMSKWMPSPSRVRELAPASPLDRSGSDPMDPRPATAGASGTSSPAISRPASAVLADCVMPSCLADAVPGPAMPVHLGFRVLDSRDDLPSVCSINCSGAASPPTGSIADSVASLVSGDFLVGSPDACAAGTGPGGIASSGLTLRSAHTGMLPSRTSNRLASKLTVLLGPQALACAVPAGPRVETRAPSHPELGPIHLVRRGPAREQLRLQQLEARLEARLEAQGERSWLPWPMGLHEAQAGAERPHLQTDAFSSPFVLVP